MINTASTAPQTFILPEAKFTELSERAELENQIDNLIQQLDSIQIEYQQQITLLKWQKIAVQTTELQNELFNNHAKRKQIIENLIFIRKELEGLFMLLEADPNRNHLVHLENMKIRINYLEKNMQETFPANPTLKYIEHKP